MHKRPDVMALDVSTTMGVSGTHVDFCILDTTPDLEKEARISVHDSCNFVSVCSGLLCVLNGIELGFLQRSTFQFDKECRLASHLSGFCTWFRGSRCTFSRLSGLTALAIPT
jgi:hypothetical protein